MEYARALDIWIRQWDHDWQTEGEPFDMHITVTWQCKPHSSHALVPLFDFSFPHSIFLCIIITFTIHLFPPTEWFDERMEMEGWREERAHKKFNRAQQLFSCNAFPFSFNIPLNFTVNFLPDIMPFLLLRYFIQQWREKCKKIGIKSVIHSHSIKILLLSSNVEMYSGWAEGKEKGKCKMRHFSFFTRRWWWWWSRKHLHNHKTCTQRMI